MASAFISHSSPDDRYVQELEQLLRPNYDEIFNDGHTIEPDDNFWARIEDAIRKCDAFYVVLSHASVQSHWVDREVEFARAEAKKVIPVRIDDCQLPESFEGRDVIDLRQGRGDKVKIAPSRILRHAPKKLFGRELWLDDLDAAWAACEKINVYTIVAWGGAGKTALVAKWVADRLASKRWPGIERYFDWSFYSQGAREQSQAAADFFIAAALKFFGDPDPQAGSPWERGQRLADLVRKHRTLLVLDGIEPLQYPPDSPQAGELKDEALTTLLQGLAMDNPGLCLVTTRESLANLDSYRETTAPEKKLNQLSKDAGIALLRHLQITGTDAELEEAWKDVGGNAFTLQLLGRFLADAHGGDIRKRDEMDFAEVDRESPGRAAMKVILTYEKWLGPESREIAILRLLSLFPGTSDAESIQFVLREPTIAGLTSDLSGIPRSEWLRSIRKLEKTTLLSSQDDTGYSISLHPLVKDYFCDQLKESGIFEVGWDRIRCTQDPIAAPLHLYFDLEQFTSSDIVEILGCFSDLYQSITGDRLEIDGTGLLEPSLICEPLEV